MRGTMNNTPVRNLKIGCLAFVILCAAIVFIKIANTYYPYRDPLAAWVNTRPDRRCQIARQLSSSGMLIGMTSDEVTRVLGTADSATDDDDRDRKRLEWFVGQPPFTFISLNSWYLRATLIQGQVVDVQLVEYD
jgi:hypothetical protein